MTILTSYYNKRYERQDATFVTKLPKGKHSTKGLGRTVPDQTESFNSPEGYEIPLGKGVDSGAQATSLLYNEYYKLIILNVLDQIKKNLN